MRGNEVENFDPARAADQFQIPMRGNESVIPRVFRRSDAVSNPHEG